MTMTCCNPSARALRAWLAAWMLALLVPAGHAAPGALDTTFGQNGFAVAGFGNIGLNSSSATGIAVQSDGKVVLVGNAQINAINFSDVRIAIARFNADGTLDTSFGSAGKLTTSLNAVNFAAGVAVQSDGKIVVAGTTMASTSATAPHSAMLARFTSAGALDTTFGNGGTVTVDVGAGGGIAAMAIQGDGRIVLAGTVVRTGTGADFLVMRFNTSGSLDTSFGKSGTFPNLTGSVHTDFGAQEQATSLAIGSDGSIVVAGVFQLGVDSSFAVARYTAGGLLDSTFNGNGRAITNFVANDHGGSSGDRALGVAVQGDGKVVVVGRAETNTGLARRDFALARYNTNGTLDSTFGNGGKVTTPFVPSDTGVDDVANAVVTQSDGRIVAAGFSGTTGNEVWALARYNANGSLDSNFGSGGKVTTDRRGIFATTMKTQVLLRNGRLIVAGKGNSDSMTAARFDAFTVFFTNVGTFELAPAENEVAALQPLDYVFTWTVPEPQNWHDLRTLRLRLRDAHETVIEIAFDEASRVFTVSSDTTSRPPAAGSAGSARVLGTRDAVLHLAEAKVIASGPTSPTVSLLLPLAFKPRLAGRSFIVEVGATDDAGNDSGFVEAGTLAVTAAR